MFETVNPSKAWASFVPALSRQGWHRNEMQNNLLPQHCATRLTFESYFHSRFGKWPFLVLVLKARTCSIFVQQESASASRDLMAQRAS